MTFLAPADLSVLRASRKVAPVVEMSSTRTIFRPRTRSLFRTAKQPFKFLSLSLRFLIRAWGGVSLTFFRAEKHTSKLRPPSIRASSLTKSSL